MPYSKSELFKFENNFYEQAFNDLEKSATPDTMSVRTRGGAISDTGYMTELTGNRVYSPYYGKQNDEFYSDKGFSWVAEATPYAISKGVETGPAGACYWTRGPATYNLLLMNSHVVKSATAGSSPLFLAEYKSKQCGVRPMTKLSYKNVIMLSAVGLKDIGSIVNTESETTEYELTLRDKTRTFEAHLTSSAIQSEDTITLPISYTNACIGENEYISYLLLDENGTTLEYRRAMASETTSGSFVLEVPRNILYRDDYTLKVFNEKLVPGVACDYASVPSELSFTVDHTNDTITSWQDVQDFFYSGRDVKLTSNITAGADDTQLVIPSKTTVTLDLNGYTLDRNAQSCVEGGRVIENNGTLTIKDSSYLTGKITGGNETNQGGGIYNKRNGTLLLEAGRISSNTAKSIGGGIYSEGIITIAGGYVEHNSSDADGGGIYAFSINLTGGTIRYNSVTNILREGGGLVANYATITGDCHILNNTRCDTTDNAVFMNPVSLPRHFAGNIGVSPYGSSFPYVLATGVDGYKLLELDLERFISDQSDYSLSLNADSKIVFDDCPLGTLTAADFTFTPPSDLTYSGTGKRATLVANEGVDIGSFFLYYKEANATNWSTAAPKAAGTYSAKIDTKRSAKYNAADDLTDTTWSFTILPKPLNISVNDVTIDKGQPVPELEVNVTGFVDGEDETLIDFVKPTASVSGTLDTLDTSLHTFTVSYTGGNATANYFFNETTTANITIGTTAIQSGDYSLDKDITKWQKDNITLTPAGEYSKISSDSVNWFDSLTLSTEGANSSQTFYLKKSNGAITDSKVITYMLDKSAPTDLKIQYNEEGFKSFLNTLTFGIFFKETVSVSANATDSLSGIANYQYYASETSVSDFSSVLWQDSLSLTPNSKKIVYIRAIDNAGNESIINYEGVVLYSDSGVTPTSAAFDKNTEVQADVNITLSLNGNTLKDIQYGSTTLNAGTDYTVSGNTVTVKKEYLAKYSVGDYTLTFSFSPMGVDNSTTLSQKNVVFAISDTTHYHSLSAVAAKAPTCTEDGNLAYWKCACGEYFSDADGEHTMSLSSTVLAALGHHFSESMVDAEHLKSEATCTNPAVYYYDCDRCDEISTSDTFEYGSALGHNFTEQIIDERRLKSEATCTNPAVYYYDCDRCDEISTSDTFEYGSALGHDFSEQIINERHLKSEAACTNPAVYYYDCCRCDEINTSDTFEYGSALGHSFTSFVYDNNATYYENGTETAKCDRCDETHTQTSINSKLIDITAPTGEIVITQSSFMDFVNSITFGLFFKESQTGTITGADEGIGLDRIFYHMSVNPLSLDDVIALGDDMWTEGSTFTLAPDWQGVVYVKITDLSDNTLYISSDGLVFDATAPVIAGVTDGGEYCITAVIQVTETNLSSDSITLDGEVVPHTEGRFTVSAKATAQTIVVTDNAGNETSTTITVLDGHVWDDGVVTNEPTASEKGKRTYTCSVCGEVRIEDIPMLPPAIIVGTDTSYIEGGTKGLTFESNAPLAEFESVSVDGKVIDKANYTIEEGSTLICILPEYLATLPAGKHTISINSTTGVASTQFMVASKSVDSDETKVPLTEDTNKMRLWIALLFVSGGIFITLRVEKRKKTS